MIGRHQAEAVMGDLEVPVYRMDWDELDAFLSSDQSPPESMMLSDLDGFLTAIAIGPERIMPGEWMPVIWGGEEPIFVDEAQMQAVLGGIFSRYNEIVEGAADGTFEPILWEDKDGIVIATDWAEGFIQGVGLRASKWERLFRSDADAHLFLPILAFNAATRTATPCSISNPKTKIGSWRRRPPSCPLVPSPSPITGAGENRPQTFSQQKSRGGTLRAPVDQVSNTRNAAEKKAD